MRFNRFGRGVLSASALCLVMLSTAGRLQAVPFSEFVDPNPAPGNQFGHTVVALSTGNVVITSPFDDFGGTDAGAIYLFSGATGALISTLRGSTAGDHVGSAGVTVLANGNYVVLSPDWNNGAIANAGAATWGSGTTGVSGVVSAANSLVGSALNDQVGGNGGPLTPVVTALANGNYVVICPTCDNGAVDAAGAATWGNGATGVSGAVSAANSLVGSTVADNVGSSGVRALTNGNYVVVSPGWGDGATGDAGAATWGSGTSGVSGPVSAANSLVGSTANDQIGSQGVTALSNGNYVVASHLWDNGSVANAGAVTWGSGTTGVSGAVSAANSLVGSTAADQVGRAGSSLAISSVTALSNGNYVVASSRWDGAVVDAGAVTWADGTIGVTGTISAANSLVGSTAGDLVGQAGSFCGVTALTNGNYVVLSTTWDNGAIADAGSATWGSGITGVSGTISAANSLVGSQAGDQVGRIGNFGQVEALTNGNYVVTSAVWNNGGIVDAGAVTLGDGTAGVSGTISAANSLVGSSANDFVGGHGVTALPNGDFVVATPFWDDGAIADAGAVTWGSGSAGVSGMISPANSLVGSQAGDGVGTCGVWVLANGNYVVVSANWDNGAVADAGAATWGSGASGVTGAVSAANSLVGSTANDQVGGCIVPPVTPLSNGNYVVASSNWDDGALADAGAATWGSGTAGVSGVVSATNSLVGTTASSGLDTEIVEDMVNGTFIARFVHEGGGRVRVGPSSGSTTSVGGGEAVAFALVGARPNPARGNLLQVAFVLPNGATARLELHDVAGRRVVAREVGALGAGRHTVNLAAGRRVAPGIYWVRLVQGTQQQRARVAVLR